MQLGGDGISFILHANVTQVQRVIRPAAAYIYPWFPTVVGSTIDVSERALVKWTWC